jgi:Holliday junction resolvasome RuvABC ATP-dependent DNA helicase subunit
MFFIGQDHIMYQLGDILRYLHDTKTGASILFRGASGYGKTELSKKCCKFLVGDEYEYCLGNNLRFNRETWVHFIDEVHTLESPEILYPIMDLDRYVFVMATNFDSILPEALTNRCKSFIFSDYSEKELIDIFKSHSKLEYSENVMKHIIDVAGRNPRVIVKTFIDTLYMHFHKRREELFNKSEQELIDEIDRIFGIREGLDRTCRDYLETLQNLGNRASINLISGALHLDQNTIKYQVEPVLLYKKLIKITSRGRELL